MKVLTRIALGVLALLLVLFLGLNIYGGPLLRVGTEKAATYALGVDCKVGRGSLNVLTGSIGLGDMVIPNPKGFTTPEAMRLGDIEVNAKTTSLLSDTIVVRKIELRAPEITIESAAGGGTNLGALIDHAKQVTGGGADGGKKGDGSGKKVLVELLRITGGKVRLAGGALQPVGSVTIPLPDIERRNIEAGGSGGDKQGVDPATLVGMILAEVTRGASQLGSAIPADLAKALDAEADRAMTEVGALKNAGENVKRAVDAAGKKLEDVFKKKQ